MKIASTIHVERHRKRLLFKFGREKCCLVYFLKLQCLFLIQNSYPIKYVNNTGALF